MRRVCGLEGLLYQLVGSMDDSLNIKFVRVGGPAGNLLALLHGKRPRAMGWVLMAGQLLMQRRLDRICERIDHEMRLFSEPAGHVSPTEQAANPKCQSSEGLAGPCRAAL